MEMPWALDPGVVGTLPCRCGKRTVKLPGQYEALCLSCWTQERRTLERRAASSGRFVAANIASDVCVACEGTDVDADGALWWCNACDIVTRVAIPKPHPNMKVNLYP
jgi:hypothetical protein